MPNAAKKRVILGGPKVPSSIRIGEYPGVNLFVPRIETFRKLTYKNKARSAFDVETTGLSPYKDRIFAFAFCDSNFNTQIHRVDGKNGEHPDDAWQILQDYFDDISVAKIAHNLKFDLSFTKMAGIKIPERTEFHDTMMMSRILRNLHPKHDLGALALEIFGWSESRDEKITKLFKAYGNYSKIPVNEMDLYQDDDVVRTQLLDQVMYPDIISDTRLFHDYINEIWLCLTTQRVEEFGIKIYRPNCDELIEELQVKLEEVRKETYKQFGEYINWNTDAQVGRILFNKLRLPPLKKTKTGKFSTKKDILFELQEANPHPVFDLIFKTRSYTNGIANVENYIRCAGEDNIIHANFNTNAAKTSRQTANNPNVQNTQKEGALKNPFPVNARRCFVVHPDYDTILIDYKGIEMRLIVGACGEEELIGIIKENGDVHLPAAECFYDSIFMEHDACFKYFISIDKEFKAKMPKGQTELEKLFKVCRKTLRNAAKNGHFAVGYGAGAPKLAPTLNLSVKQAFDGYKRYKARFPRVANFTKQIAVEVKEFGYIINSFGRRFNVMRNKAYVGGNYRIQSDGAGILKRAENRVNEYSITYLNDLLRLQNKVHDELILAKHKSLKPFENTILHHVSNLMTYMPEINVPLEVEFKRTITTWDKAKEFHLEELTRK